jgi:nucleoside-diphosphate-sugar epimerase
MRVFLAGGTGVVGGPLVERLVSRGHVVVATTRSPEKTAAIRAMGGEPAVVDGLDASAVLRAVVASRPDVVVHQMTALAGLASFRNLDATFVSTNRLRSEGTAHLIAAARAAGARKVVAQSFTGWPNAAEGGRVKSEEDPLETRPPASMARTLDAIRTLERSVLEAGDLVGVVVRYGALYGPGTSLAPGGSVLEAVRRRRLPLFGAGAGVWSFTHVADAAEATRIAIETGPAGILNLVDDDPAEVSVWLPELARAIGAPSPRRVPEWLGRLLAGEAAAWMMTRQRGSSNAKARRVLGWAPVYASWREGFRREFLPSEPGAGTPAAVRIGVASR